MATELSTNVSKASQKLPDFTKLDPTPAQISIEQFESLLPLDLATANYGKIDVEVAAIKANAIKTQKVQYLYLEVLELYECEMFNLAFDACNDAINLKRENQAINELLKKLLEKINNKLEEEKFIVLTDKENEFSNKIIECENSIRELKKNDGFNNEQKLKIYSEIFDVLHCWGTFFNGNSISSLEKFKKALRVSKICIESAPNNILFHIKQSGVLNNIGVCYMDLQVFDKALVFYEKAIDGYTRNIEMDKDKKDHTYEKIKGNYSLAYNNIAQVHNKVGDNLVSKKEYKKAHSEYEKGLKFLRKSQNVCESNDNLKLMQQIYKSCDKLIDSLLAKKIAT